MVSSKNILNLATLSSVIPLVLCGPTELGNKSTPPVLKCGQAKIDIDVPKSFLMKHNIQIKDSSELHFAKHKDCFAVENGDSYKLQIFAPFTSCGTNVEHGNDDFAYTNEVVFENNDKQLSVFQFRCIYEDKYIVSSGPISPTKRTLQFHSGEGEFEVAMEMYRGPSFSFMDKMADNPTIRLNDPVYVDIEFTSNLGYGDPGRDLVTSLKSCYATATPKHTDMAQDKYHNLISGMCVSPDDPTVEILENGNSDNARFKFNMFKWKGYISYIYLHCEVHLCNRTIETCRHDEKMCHNRNQKRKKRGITLPSRPYNEAESESYRRTKRQSNQKYTIEADMGEYEDDNISEVGESNVFYDLNSKDDSNYYNNHNQQSIDGMLGNYIPEEEEMTDFITRGPIIFDVDDDVGSGQINSTIIDIDTISDDEFLRVYIFSSIAIVICIIAMILTILVALKRRKAGLEKLAGINQVFNNNNNNNGYARQSIDGSLTNTQHTDLSQKASIITGISSFPDNMEKPNILPAITGLPLPPTPELPSSKLPPVLGSPVTANSSIHHDTDQNSSSGSSNHNLPQNDMIYHNIQDNKIIQDKIPRPQSQIIHNSHHHVAGVTHSNRGPSVQSHHNRGLHHQHSQMSSNNIHHQQHHQQHNQQHVQKQRANLQKAESSRLHSRPNLMVQHNTKVERSKTSCNPSNHPQLFNKPSHNKNHINQQQQQQNYHKNDRSRLVENNTVSHTLSNYSN